MRQVSGARSTRRSAKNAKSTRMNGKSRPRSRQGHEFEPLYYAVFGACIVVQRRASIAWRWITSAPCNRSSSRRGWEINAYTLPRLGRS